MNITRKAYLAGEVSFQDYYRHIAHLAGVAFNPADPFIKRVKKALDQGDEHLNSISLQTWDIRAVAAEHAIREACKQIEGEFYSLSVGVCTMKQAAKDAAKEL